MRRSAVILFTSVLFAGSAAAAPPSRSDFEQVLLPIIMFNDVPGALGTLWATEFAGFNGGTQEAIAFESAPGTVVPARTQFGVFPKHAANGPNLANFLYVEKAHAADFAYNLRIREIVRGTTPTQLPVVHERDFRSGETILPNVPIDPGSRTRLRIYGISSPDGTGAVRVRVVPPNNGAVKELVLALTPPPGSSRLATAGEFPEQPAYVDAGDLNALVGGKANVRIEIEPLTTGLVYWPLVTVTDNQTQQLMTVTPQ
jgi:hypothetical protein